MKNRSRYYFLAPLAAALALAALASAALRAGEETAPDRKGRRADGPPPPEMREYHEKALKLYDANSDGKLDEDERAIMREDVDAGKFPPPPFRGGGPRGGLPKELLEKYDADKDGKLNETERAALKADIDSGKIPPPPRRSGGPRGEGKDGPPPAPPAASNT